MSKSERNDNHKHKEFVSRFEQLALRLRLHCVKDFYYQLRIFTKEPQQQWSTQDPELQLQWSLQALGATKITNSLYNFLECRMEKLSSRSLCERKFSWKEWTWELKTCRNWFGIESSWNLKKKLGFSCKICCLDKNLLLNPLQMTHI